MGISSVSEGINSTVVGNSNKLTGVKNGRNNSIVVGQSLEVEGTHNAVFGTDYNNDDNDDHKLTKVAGEANTVLGVGNLVGYTRQQNGTDWIYTKVGSKGSDENVAVGLNNTVNGGSVVVGINSVAEGVANIVMGCAAKAESFAGIAMGHAAETDGTAGIAVGQGANAKGYYSIAVGGGAISEGYESLALGKFAKGKVSYGVALGSYSVADTDRGVAGYDPSNADHSGDTTGVWKSSAPAVSVGDAANNVTRQITNVAAGTQDTDAVNVAQLKQAVTGATEAAKTTIEAGENVTVAAGTTANSYKISAKDTTLKADTNALKLEGKNYPSALKIPPVRK